MPYIDKYERLKLNHAIEKLAVEIDNEGELNYTISKLIKLLIQKWGEKYSNYNKVIGVLECAKHELYRRDTALYEDLKKDENGDI